MKDSIIHNYLSGDATEEEMTQLRDWLKESPGNRSFFYDLKAIWNARHAYQTIDKATIDHSLSRMNARIDRISHTKRPTIRKYGVRYGSIAAIALLCIAISYSYFYKRETHPRKETSFHTFANLSDAYTIETVHLPDGTTVWLHTNTRLTAPATFDEDKRIVTLEGEAFFEVKQDAKHPFIVRTNAYEVQVIGTSFNVNTRKRIGVSETILMTGSVRLQDKQGTSLAVLRPGQQALYTKKNKKIEIHEVDANALTAWRYGLISLTNVTADEIRQCLEEIYDTPIPLDISSLKGCRYNFSFKRSHKLDTILEQFIYITGIPRDSKAR